MSTIQQEGTRGSRDQSLDRKTSDVTTRLLHEAGPNILKSLVNISLIPLISVCEYSSLASLGKFNC